LQQAKSTTVGSYVKAIATCYILKTNKQKDSNYLYYSLPFGFR